MKSITVKEDALIKTDEELATRLSRAGDLELKINAIEAERAKEHARIDRHFNKQLRPVRKERYVVLTTMVRYCGENRDRLISIFGKKTLELLTGELWWRLIKAYLEIKDPEKVINYIKKRKLRGFLRIKGWEIKRTPLLEAIQEGSVKIPGVRVVEDDERFFLRPKQMPEDFKFRKSDLPKLKLLQ